MLGAILLVLPAASGAAAAEHVPSVAIQISDVANRELPAVILKGGPAPYSRLADLMRAQHHGVLLPGPIGRAYLDKSEADYVRFEKQIPDPRSAAKLRRLLIGLAAGRPDYSDMEANMVQATHRYLPGLRQMLLPLGALKTTTFKRVTPEGGDVYDVRFAKGARRAMIGLSPSGKIAAAGFPP